MGTTLHNFLASSIFPESGRINFLSKKCKIYQLAERYPSALLILLWSETGFTLQVTNLRALQKMTLYDGPEFKDVTFPE